MSSDSKRPSHSSSSKRGPRRPRKDSEPNGVETPIETQAPTSDEPEDSQEHMLADHEGHAGVRPQARNQGVPADEYLLRLNWDRASQKYIADFAEVPEIQVSESRREDAVEQAYTRLEDHLEISKRRGEPVPEPILSKSYPPTLEIKLSQGMYRRLDVLSRQEKTDMDRLVLELITSALTRRLEAGGSRPAQSSGRPSHPHKNNGQRQGQAQHGRRQGRRNFQQTMDSRENFMEYVRNLEKGGGNPGWKKR